MGFKETVKSVAQSVKKKFKGEGLGESDVNRPPKWFLGNRGPVRDAAEAAEKDRRSKHKKIKSGFMHQTKQSK